MCNETKANTNIGVVASPEPKKSFLPPNFVGSIETPFGIHHINRGDAQDHALMRSAQLASLLTLMHGDGLDRFRALGRNTQDSLIWLAMQLAEESEAMIDIVVADVKGGQQ